MRRQNGKSVGEKRIRWVIECLRNGLLNLYLQGTWNIEMNFTLLIKWSLRLELHFQNEFSTFAMPALSAKFHFNRNWSKSRISKMQEEHKIFILIHSKAFVSLFRFSKRRNFSGSDKVCADFWNKKHPQINFSFLPDSINSKSVFYVDTSTYIHRIVLIKYSFELLNH